MQHLHIYEINDGSTVQFNIHNPEGDFIINGDTLEEAVDFCYQLGGHFTVHTYAAWERENN